jgi:hypothetical protein
VWCMGKGAWKTRIGEAHNRQTCKMLHDNTPKLSLKIACGSANLVLEKPSREERVMVANLFYLVVGLIRTAGTEASGKVGSFHDFGTSEKPGRGVRSGWCLSAGSVTLPSPALARTRQVRAFDPRYWSKTIKTTSCWR